jgi:hypothetical protein
MASNILRSVFEHAPSHREAGDHHALSLHTRIALAIVAACAAAVFSVAAPLAGNPTHRLMMLDDKPTVSDGFEALSERAPEPATEWVTVDTIDMESTPVVTMPPLDVTSQAPTL